MLGYITLTLFCFAASISAMAIPRKVLNFPAMACGNHLSRENENVCRSFNGGGVCVWERHSKPHCRVGEQPPSAGRFLRQAMSQVDLPQKPANAFAVIQAAKTYALQRGNQQIKSKADERERWISQGGGFGTFDNSESPQCLLDVPMCHRVACGGPGAQTNAGQCLSNPQCCFDQALYQYQFTFGSEFMGGAPACYQGPTSKIFRTVSASVKPWNSWYSATVLDLYKSEIMKPLTNAGMSVCASVDPYQNFCGWQGISQIECRLKDCCYTGSGTCVYPGNQAMTHFKSEGSYPELETADVKESQCSANPFNSPKIYNRLSCQQLSSDPYSVLRCHQDCCLDKNAIHSALKTHNLIRSVPTPANSAPQQQPFRPRPSYPNYPPPQPRPQQNAGFPGANPFGGPPSFPPQSNPFQSGSQMNPDMMQMIATILSDDNSSPNPFNGGKSNNPAFPSGLPMMPTSGTGNNPFPPSMMGNNPFMYQSGGGAPNGILELLAKAAYPNSRSLGIDNNLLMMMANGGMGGSGSGYQSMNPASLFQMLANSEDGEGFDMTKLLQMGINPFGGMQSGSQSMNPMMLNALLSKNSDGEFGMDDILQMSLMSGGFGGQQQGGKPDVGMMLMLSKLMKKDDSDGKNSGIKNAVLLSLISRMRQQQQQQQSNQQQQHYPNHSAQGNYNSYPGHQSMQHQQQNAGQPQYQAPPTNYGHSQYQQPPPTQYQAPLGGRSPGQAQPPYNAPQSNSPPLPDSNVQLVKNILSGYAVDSFNVACPYVFVKIGKFPDLSHAVRGCCKVVACYHKKEIKQAAPAMLAPSYGQWSAWTPCDRTCGSDSFKTRTRTCITDGRTPGKCPGLAYGYESCRLSKCLDAPRSSTVGGQAPYNQNNLGVVPPPPLPNSQVPTFTGGNSLPPPSSQSSDFTGGTDFTSSQGSESSEPDLDALMAELLRELDEPSHPPSQPLPAKPVGLITPPTSQGSIPSFPGNFEAEPNPPPPPMPQSGDSAPLPPGLQSVSSEEDFLNFIKGPAPPVQPDSPHPAQPHSFKQPAQVDASLHYSEWSKWTRCDRSCGSGLKIRVRVCNKPGSCSGSSEEITGCENQPCKAESQGAGITRPIESDTNSFEPTFTPPKPVSKDDENIPEFFGIDNGNPTFPPASQAAVVTDGSTPAAAKYAYGAWSEWSECKDAVKKCSGKGSKKRQRPCFVTSNEIDYKPIPQEDCEMGTEIKQCVVACFPDVPGFEGGKLQKETPHEDSMPRQLHPSELPDPLLQPLPPTPSQPEIIPHPLIEPQNSKEPSVPQPMPSLFPPPSEAVGEIDADGVWTEWSVCIGAVCPLSNEGTRTREKTCTSLSELCRSIGAVLVATQHCTVQC